MHPSTEIEKNRRDLYSHCFGVCQKNSNSVAQACKGFTKVRASRPFQNTFRSFETLIISNTFSFDRLFASEKDVRVRNSLSYEYVIA